jgi:hypothetical protein
VKDSTSSVLEQKVQGPILIIGAGGDPGQAMFAQIASIMLFRAITFLTLEVHFDT